MSDYGTGVRWPPCQTCGSDGHPADIETCVQPMEALLPEWPYNPNGKGLEEIIGDAVVAIEDGPCILGYQCIDCAEIFLPSNVEPNPNGRAECLVLRLDPLSPSYRGDS